MSILKKIFFSKQLLYLSNDQLTATVWQNNSYAPTKTFPNNEEGLQAFGEYLDAYVDIPAALCVDLVEEDVQRTTIPHVLGRAHHNLLQRKLAQLYRDTPYCRATLQA